MKFKNNGGNSNTAPKPQPIKVNTKIINRKHGNQR